MLENLMMEILANLFGFGIPIAFFLLSYIGVHIVFEKDAKKTIPLIWEKGGLLHKLLNRKDYEVFDKSKIKYRDGDNT
jgi:TM2 domain-containing membrane protein YozV